jgi:hypothetical protein
VPTRTNNSGGTQPLPRHRVCDESCRRKTNPGNGGSYSQSE